MVLVGEEEQVLVRIYFIIVMIRWTGLALWELEFPFSGSLTSTFLGAMCVLKLEYPLYRRALGAAWEPCVDKVNHRRLSNTGVPRS